MRERTYRITLAEGSHVVEAEGAGGRTCVIARFEQPQALLEWLAQQVGTQAGGALGECLALRAEVLAQAVELERAQTDAASQRQERERGRAHAERLTRQLAEARVHLALSGLTATSGQPAYDAVLAYAQEVARENARLRARLGDEAPMSSGGSEPRDASHLAKGT